MLRPTILDDMHRQLTWSIIMNAESMMINTKHNGVNSMVDNQQEESLQATLASCAAPMNKTTRVCDLRYEDVGVILSV